MKRIVGAVVAVVVILGIFAALFILPTMRLKSELDKLASSLPPSVGFTYRNAHYSLFSRKVTLDDPVLKFASPSLEIHADSLEIDHGNPDLDKAIAEARRAPDLQNDDVTPIAARITVTNMHTAYASVDVHIGREIMDDPRMQLRQVFSPLPKANPVSGGPAEADAEAMQRIALYTVATAYKHAEADDVVVAVDDEEAQGGKVTFRTASLSSDGFDHGNIASTVLKGFDIASGTFDVNVDSITAGSMLHRDFWTAVRDGQPMAVAVEKFQGASQTIDNVKATINGQPMASLERLTLGNVGYKGGLPVSLDIVITRLALDPAIVPDPGTADLFRALGYKTITLDARASYVWDQTAQTMRLDPVSIVVDQGGTLSLSAAAVGADPKLSPATYKLAGATLRYDDASLFVKWLDYMAAQTKRAPADIKAAYVRWLEQQKPAFKNDPALLAAFGGIEMFINDPHSLVIALVPAHPIGLSQFDSASPQTFIGKLGLTVTAPGSAPLPAAAKAPTAKH